MRHSDIAYVLIRLRSEGHEYLLLHRHAKWGDWSLVGGHVEPGEEGDWLATAAREACEEMAPLKHQEDFELERLGVRLQWGPRPSRSACGLPTEYRAEYFILRFLRTPSEVLRMLPRGDFQLVPIERVTEDASVSLPVRKLLEAAGNRLGALPWSWDGDVPLQVGVGSN